MSVRRCLPPAVGRDPTARQLAFQKIRLSPPAPLHSALNAWSLKRCASRQFSSSCKEQHFSALFQSCSLCSSLPYGCARLPLAGVGGAASTYRWSLTSKPLKPARGGRLGTIMVHGWSGSLAHLGGPSCLTPHGRRYTEPLSLNPIPSN